MKKSIIILVCTIFFVFTGCDYFLPSDITFEEISQPYLDDYGEPDEKIVNPYSDEIIYWTWDYDTYTIEVTFWKILDDWEVESERRVEIPHYFTFEEVSRPYLNQYGQPEEVYEYASANYHSIEWWWWTKGFEVTFLLTTYDDVSGWTVDSTYSFSPIN